MNLSYTNFIRSLILVVISMTIVILNTENSTQVAVAILCTGLAIEGICVIRLISLGYTFSDALRRLFLGGDKLLIFRDRLPEK